MWLDQPEAGPRRRPRFWFTPFANLVIPYLVMRVLWSSFGDDRLVPELWWAAWIGFLMLRFVGYVVAVVNQPFGDVLGAIGEVIGVVAAIMLITMISQVTHGERDRYAQLLIAVRQGEPEPSPANR